MAQQRKVLVLALDAASPPLIHRWCADGTLPNIARAMSAGVVAPTLSMEGMEVGATWPSFYTGLNPAGHGICWTDRVIPGTYRQQDLGPVDVVGLRPFWQDISDAGKRVVVMDVPFVPPPDSLNGVQVVDWGMHDGIYDFQTVPRALKHHLRKTYGIHPPPSTCDTQRLDAAGYRELRDQMVHGVELRGAMTRELLSDGRWDFGIQVFNEVHCAGHILWHYHDPGHPGHDPETVARDGDLLRDVYVATDREVGRLLDAWGTEATVMIMSLHGMAHMHGSSLLLPAILERLGALTTLSGKQLATSGQDTRPPRPRARGLRGLVRAIIPAAVRMPLFELRQWINRRWLRRGTPIDIDPAKTKAFQMGFGAGASYSGIRLNIVDREPNGVLHRGAEVDAFIDELRVALMELVDPETGRPLVRRLVAVSELHKGPRVEDLPDLLVEWEYDPGRGNTSVGDGTGGVWRGYSDRIGAVEHPNGGGRTGNHRAEGVLIMTGPGVTSRTLERTISEVDFAPTILKMLGVSTQPGDGEAVRELVGAATTPPSRTSPSHTPDR